MNVEEILIRQLKLQNDLQEENNKLLREILRALIKKQLFLIKINYQKLPIENFIFSVYLNYSIRDFFDNYDIYISNLNRLINVKKSNVLFIIKHSFLNSYIRCI